MNGWLVMGLIVLVAMSLGVIGAEVERRIMGKCDGTE